MLGDLDLFGAFWIWRLSWNPLSAISCLHPTAQSSWCWLMQRFPEHDSVCNCTETHGDPWEKHLGMTDIDPVSVFHTVTSEGLARANMGWKNNYQLLLWEGIFVVFLLMAGNFLSYSFCENGECCGCYGSIMYFYIGFLVGWLVGWEDYWREEVLACGIHGLVCFIT